MLVCPELRQHALTLLPALDPDRLFEVELRPVRPRTPATLPRPRLVLVEAEPVPPRPVALLAYVTEALVLGVLRGAALIAVIAAVAFVLAQ